MLLVNGRTYIDSISGAYKVIAALRSTVPFPARGKGLSAEANKIISLKIRLKAGALSFASSITGLIPNGVNPLEVQPKYFYTKFYS